MSADDRDRRTIRPTPKRIDEFRKRGEIALSRDLSAIATAGGGALLALMFAHSSAKTLVDFTRGTFANVDGQSSELIGRQAAMVFISLCMPAVVGAFAGYIVSMALQLGWPPAFRLPKPDFSRLFNPQSIAQIFSPKMAVGRALKSTAKVGFVMGAAVIAALYESRRFMEQPALGAYSVGSRLVAVAARMAAYAGTALAVIAVVDYIVSRRMMAAKMRMTPEEFKREHREQEGDPQIRRRRKQRMRELAKRRMQVAVKSADVVMVNPTEYAVALRYLAGQDRAPRVVAKGRGSIAERIREIARQSGIPIIAEPPLTRLIHKIVPEGREIPANLYHAVATVLAHVYRVRRRRAQ